MQDSFAPTGFARQQMIPPAPPPVEQGGMGRRLWALFSGPLNIALTLLGVALIWAIVGAIWPWLAHSVWTAESLAQCRQITGPEVSGACWAVIRDRWSQFVFGFYPSELYWRPVLALGLFFLALGPVLLPRLPRRMLWLSVAYPGVAVWLLWGGSLWPAIWIVAGLVLGAVMLRRLPLWVVAVAVVIWMGWAVPVLSDLGAGVAPIRLTPVASDKFGGFLLSTIIGVSGIAMSLPLGIMLALARQSDLLIVRVLAVAFIETIRGVPLITLLFVASLLLNYFLPKGVTFDLILRVVIMVTIFAAAYMAEVIRGGLAALPKGQYEAADALGLDYWKAQRLVILPQALKIAIPGIVSTFIGVFKDTTLVTFVGLYDPLKGVSDAIRATTAWKGIYWEPYIFVGAVFFVFCYGMSRYSAWLERRLKRDHR